MNGKKKQANHLNGNQNFCTFNLKEKRKRQMNTPTRKFFFKKITYKDRVMDNYNSEKE